MTTQVRQILESFEALAESDKRELALQILKRLDTSEGDIQDAGLVEAADELFQALDREESQGPIS